MMEFDTGEQQRQIKALEAHLERFVEDKFAERKLGTVLRAPDGKQAHFTRSLKHTLCYIQAISRQTEMLSMFPCMQQTAWHSLT